MKYIAYFFVVCFFFSHPLCAQNLSTRIVIRNVNVIPMDAAQPTLLQKQDVIIEHGEIKKIRPTSGKTYKGYEIIDGTDKFLIPGLADMHVHLPNKNSVFQNREFQLMSLLSGITTMRQMRGGPDNLLLRDSIRNGLMPGCNLYISTPFYRNSKTFSEAECRDSLEKYKRQGYDFVKYLYGLNFQQYDTLVAVASSLHMQVVGHAPKNSLQKAVSARQLSIEHIDPFIALYRKDSVLFWKVIDTMIASKLYTLPNLEWNINTGMSTSMMKKRDIYGKNAYGIKFIQDDSLDAMIKTYTEQEIEQYKKDPVGFANNIIYDSEQVVTYKYLLGAMHRKGVQFLISATSGDFILPGYNCIDEMNLFVHAGISPYETIKCATVNAAACLSETTKWGSISENKQADMVLLSANPLDDINNLRKVELTMVKGKALTHDYLLSELKKHYPQ